MDHAKQSSNSIADYLNGELLSDVRHEYIGGRIYAMVGASARHNLICVALSSSLHQHLRGSACQVFMADMKLRLSIAGDDIFYYPDILVACREEDNATYYREQPCLIAEILSESTERIDRREKFLAYQQIESLQDYLLIYQDKPGITRFNKENNWQPEHMTKEEELILPSIAFRLPLSVMYQDIKF